MNKDILILSTYIKISTYRLKTFTALTKNEVLIPTEIAKESGIRINHISKILRELKEHKLIVCLNEETRKGRLYTLTPLGKEVSEYMKL